jgi:hypothetical protein
VAEMSINDEEANAENDEAESSANWM